jgi:hypothetical protein
LDVAYQFESKRVQGNFIFWKLWFVFSSRATMRTLQFENLSVAGKGSYEIKRHEVDGFITRRFFCRFNRFGG